MVRRNLAPLLAGAELGQASLRDASLRRATRARAMALRLAAWVARAALLPPVAGLGPLSARDPPSRFFVGVACGWERWSIHMWPASLLWPRHHVRRQASLSSWRWRSSWLHPWAVKAVRPHTTQRVFWLSVRVQLEVRSDFVAESSETLVYDGDGNLVRDGRWVYSWDAENRLVRVMSYGAGDRAGWRRVDWAYDALGRRIRQTSYVLSNGVWVVTEDLKFVSDPVWFGRHIVELNATNNALVRTYVWGLDLSGTMDGAGGVGGLLWVRLGQRSGVRDAFRHLRRQRECLAVGLCYHRHGDGALRLWPLRRTPPRRRPPLPFPTPSASAPNVRTPQRGWYSTNTALTA
jgi:YD repeat-containing protein